MSTASQKTADVINQLNSALLQKDILTEQLEQVTEKVKALRNLLAGVDLGRQVEKEQVSLAETPNEVD
jgi:hypothetical protein